MTFSPFKKLSPKNSPAGKSSGKAKPSLTLTCPPAPFSPIVQHRDGFCSPALIPIPSPIHNNQQHRVDENQVPAHTKKSPQNHPIQWSISTNGNGSVMLLSPLPWTFNGDKNLYPMAPHLSEYKEGFSPLPVTPIIKEKDDGVKRGLDGEVSVFEQMQTQYMMDCGTEITDNISEEHDKVMESLDQEDPMSSDDDTLTTEREPIGILDAAESSFAI